MWLHATVPLHLQTGWIFKQVSRRSGCRSSTQAQQSSQSRQKDFQKESGEKRSVKKDRAKDSRSCVEARGMAWQRRVDGGGGGARRVAMPLQGRAGTVARQWARADAHHSLAGRRGGRAREAGSGVRALVLVSLLGLAPSCAGHATPFPLAVCCCRGGAGSARSGQKGIHRNHLTGRREK